MSLVLYLLFYVPVIVLLAFLPSYKGMKSLSPLSGLMIMFFVSLMLILRDPSAPADSVNYSVMYASVVDFSSVFDAYHRNYTYSFLQYLGKTFGLSFDAFSISLSVFSFFLSAYGLKLIFNQSRQFVLSLALFVLTSTFILLFTNVVRQGLALSFMLVLIGCLIHKRYISSVLIAVLAVFSHFSAIVFILAVVIAFLIPLSSRSYLFLSIALPVLPIVGGVALSFLASFGGVLSKIDAFSDKEYSNTLVYVKGAVLYLCLLLFIFAKLRRGDVPFLSRFRFLSDVYLYLVSVTFLCFPVLLLSSRFLYYAGAMLPIMFVATFYYWRGFNINFKAVVFFVCSVFFGFFAYFYKSTGMQLGIY